MTKRLLVTGYGGFVAGSVVKQAGAGWDVFAVSRSKVSNGQQDITHLQFDLGEGNQLRQAFHEVQPAAVIHTAAIADIDYCQSHQEEAEAVNVGVTKHLTELCRQHGTKMVFCSTDTVFGGKQGPYVEEDAPHPVNYYAETKVRAEQILKRELDNMVIARLALVVGFPMIGAGNSFLARMVASFQQNIPVLTPVNEIRTPIDVVTLGRALLELASSDFTGIIHLAGNTRLNRYELALQIASLLDFPQALVTPTDSAAASNRAPRPSDASLNNSKAARMLKTPMLSLTDGLRLTLATLEK